ncbi:MAG: c-type cytochrome [Fluviicola sp.]|nr:c-type cytochrome [Fluviicola sp.]
MRFIFAFLTISLLFSCSKNKIEKMKPWGFYYDSNFPAPVYTFQNNTVEYSRFLLGKELFFDELLSSDSTVSCATCHEQAHGFASHNSAFSAGVNNQLGTRNSPAIFNMAWNPSFMWDGGINHIEVMPIGPITNPVEMNETMQNVVQKLQNSQKYRKLFKDAYGSEYVTEQNMLRAFAQFLSMIISDKSKYDKVKRGEATFTAQEQSGYNLFQAKCSQCHTEPLFTDYQYRNNGLDASFTDLGRGLITQNTADYGKFKVPTLRNVELTYPYMHDGRFFTLNQVLDHYATGIVQSSTIDPLIQSGIPLTNTEKQQLIAFLKTLTDYELMSNPWLMEPHY